MKTEWRGTTYDVRQTKANPGNVDEGDFIWSGATDGYVRVVTVQPNCPSFENMSKTFIMFTCERRDGTIVPIRGDQGALQILKKNRKLVRV